MKNVLIILFGLTVLGCQNTKQEKQVAQDNDQANEETAILEGEDCDENFYQFFLEEIVFGVIKPNRIKAENWKSDDIHPEKEYVFEFGNENMQGIGWNSEDRKKKKHLTKYSAKNSTVTDYLFEKIDCKWFLTSITTQNIEAYTNNKFLVFLYNFSTDSVFRVSHIRFPLKIGYLTEDFSDMEKFVSIEDAPKYDFFNQGEIIFLHDGHFSNSTIKIFYAGTNNGINGFYVFEFINGTWLLTEDNDFSV